MQLKNSSSSNHSLFYSCFRNNGKSGNCCATSQISCCGFESNPPREFEDEIYSEICSNNHRWVNHFVYILIFRDFLFIFVAIFGLNLKHIFAYFSVRQVMQQQQQQDLLTNNHYSTLGRNSGPGTILALGILLHQFSREPK